MSLIEADNLEFLSPEQREASWASLMDFGAWAVKNGCRVEYVQDPLIDSEITVVRLEPVE